MAAPAFGSAGTYLTGGTGTTAAIPVPASVASGDVIVVHLYIETTGTITLPSGFAEAANSPISVTGASAHSQHVYWKRATGADSGTYDFTWTGSVWREGVAERYTGCVASGDPFDVTNAAARDTAGSTSPAVSLTTTGADRLLVFSPTIYAAAEWVPPTGFTEQVDPSGETMAVSTKEQASAGSTGSVTSDATATEAMTAFLGALLPVGAGGAPTARVMVVQSAQRLA